MNFNQLSTETIIYFIILTRICILLFAFKILGWKAVSPFYFKSLKYISSDSHDHAQCRKNLARFILLTVKSPHYSQLKQRVFNSNSKYFEEHLKPHDITFRFGSLSTPNAIRSEKIPVFLEKLSRGRIITFWSAWNLIHAASVCLQHRKLAA